MIFEDYNYIYIYFFLLNTFTQDIPLGWKPLQMWGPAQHTLIITQTIGLQHISTNIYTQLYTYMDYHMIW